MQFSGPMALGDLNGDGTLDVVASGSLDFGVIVLFGDGAGGLGAPLRLETGGSVAGVQVADVDGDGLADVVVTNDTDTASALLGGRRFQCR
jgi:hypothetical protein